MIDKVEKQKRIYEISLLLRKKSVNYIVQFVAQNWGLRKRQTYNYIRSARQEWKKYFVKLKYDGMSYHLAQLRDLKDTAYDKEDCRLVFNIAKEEAKLMGIYPAERHKREEEKKVIVIGKDPEEKLIKKLDELAGKKKDRKLADRLITLGKEN
ncbi:hypothetical protein ES708_26358 [subsurface metagenome]